MSRPQDGRLDAAIDRAVREMLDVEPPAGLRGRVVDRIRQPRRAFAWTWFAVPVAAAAAVVLAVVLQDGRDRAIAPPPAIVASDQHLPRPDSRAPEPVPDVRPQPLASPAAPRVPRASQTISAAVVTEPDFQGVRVEALAGPAPLAVARLAGPPPPAVATIDVAPIQIRALEVNALTETPRERREE
jgi:hypothetical protein